MDYVLTPLTTELNVSDIVSLHYFPYTKDFEFLGEKHDFYELVIIDSGEVTVTEDSVTHVLTKGEGYLHAPNVYHSIRANNVFSNIIIISFKCQNDCVKEAEGKLSLNSTTKFLTGLIINEGRKNLTQPLDIVLQPKINFNDLHFASKQFIKNTLELILINLIRKDKGDTAIKYGVLSEKIDALLKANLDKKITVTEIARSVGYCPTHIKKVFKAETNQSIIDRFISLKIDRAKQLLSEKTLSISEIAETLGFDNVQYFSSQFKKRVNITPTEYALSTEGIIK